MKSSGRIGHFRPDGMLGSVRLISQPSGSRRVDAPVAGSTDRHCSAVFQKDLWTLVTPLVAWALPDGFLCQVTRVLVALPIDLAVQFFMIRLWTWMAPLVDWALRD